MKTGILIINILLLIGEIILGCILLFGKSYLQKKGENTADKEDSQKIAMLKKIGENIATKQDIQDITNKVESIKASYNESLERHKMELQKEFETHKYIVGLCNSLDNQLIKLISDCSKIIGAEGAIYPENDEGLIYSARKLSNFLHAYRTRYESNKQISELMDITLKIKLEAELQGEMYNKLSKQDKTALSLIHI